MILDLQQPDFKLKVKTLVRIQIYEPPNPKEINIKLLMYKIIKIYNQFIVSRINHT